MSIEALPDRSRHTQKNIHKTVGAICVFMALVLFLFLHKMLSPRILSPIELRANGAIIFEQPRIIRDFSLVNHNGKDFTLGDLQGRWTLMFFGFTQCPDICPTTLSSLAGMHKQLTGKVKEQLAVVMVTVDPARDTSERLSEYVPFFNTDFIGVTGPFKTLMSLTQDVNVAFRKVQLGGDPDDYTIDHAGQVVLFNPLGHYHGLIKPPFKISRLKSIVETLVYKGI